MTSQPFPGREPRSADLCWAHEDAWAFAAPLSLFELPRCHRVSSHASAPSRTHTHYNAHLSDDSICHAALKAVAASAAVWSFMRQSECDVMLNGLRRKCTWRATAHRPVDRFGQGHTPTYIECHSHTHLHAHTEWCMHEKDAHLAAGPVTVAPKRQQAVVLLPVLIATGVEWGGINTWIMGEEEKGRQRWLSPLCCSILLLRTHPPRTNSSVTCPRKHHTVTETGPITAQQGESHIGQLSRSAAKAKAKIWRTLKWSSHECAYIYHWGGRGVQDTTCSWW